MLKRDPKGVFQKHGWFIKTWRFCSGKENRTELELIEEFYQKLLIKQQDTPQLVKRDISSKKKWWMFKDEFYWEDEGYSEHEVKALILDKIGQKEKKVQRAIARIRQDDSDSLSERQPIPDDVKIFVWQRDSGRCVKCGSQQNLEFDHIIPFSKGGSNTARNLQLLCESCNRSKGANLF